MLSDITTNLTFDLARCLVHKRKRQTGVLGYPCTLEENVKIKRLRDGLLPAFQFETEGTVQLSPWNSISNGAAEILV